MKVANIGGRAKLVIAHDRIVDVADLSGGRFGPHPSGVYDDWAAFVSWAATVDRDRVVGQQLDVAQLGPPSPTPRQVFAVALNYVDHAAESGMTAPADPVFFTKFMSAFSGPISDVQIPGPRANVDWETELVVIVGAPARRVTSEAAWGYVAGLTVGQDISERVLQRSGPSPQYSLGKSHAGFAPNGPWLVTPDELSNPNDLAIGCEVNGVLMQSARTTDMIFPVADLVSYLSHVVTLYPGDVIFTGTPPGVGMGRDPKVFLKPGDVLTSHIEGLGDLRQTFVRGPGVPGAGARKG